MKWGLSPLSDSRGRVLYGIGVIGNLSEISPFLLHGAFFKESAGIHFDQKKRRAGRGYGYVGVSRFKRRSGCNLFGKLRVTDFLPVGDEKEEEVRIRGKDSDSTHSSEEGLEYAYASADSGAEDMGEDAGLIPADFC